LGYSIAKLECWRP